MAALFHDLGHLPYSHDFEEGMDRYWKDLPEPEQKSSPIAPLFVNQSSSTDEADSSQVYPSDLREWVQNKRPTSNLKDISDPLGELGLIAATGLPSEVAPAVTITEQALRMAALFHDLGHLPYSHDFEEGMDRYWKDLPEPEQKSSPIAPLFVNQSSSTDEADSSQERLKIHERIGHDLAQLILQQLTEELTPGPMAAAAVLSFECAAEILRHTPDDPKVGSKNSLTQWLHTLIDGDLDVDRCDFVLRDGRAYGFEFAFYDLRRLIDSVAMWHDPVRGYETVVKTSGRPALETFFIARYRIYQVGIRHHKVAQLGIALRVCIAEILRKEANGLLKEFLDDIKLVTEISRGPPQPDKRNRLLERYSGYDDIWWTSIMRQQRDAPISYALLNRWLPLVCSRARGPQSLWKRIDNFPYGDRIADWNACLPEWKDAPGQISWRATERELEKDGILVLRQRFTPWEPDPSAPEESWLRGFVPGSPPELASVTRLSPMIRRLHEVWSQDVQVQAFKHSDAVTANAKEIADRLIPQFGGV